MKTKGLNAYLFLISPFEYKKNSIMDISYEKDRDTLCKADEMENVDCVEFDTKANARSNDFFYEYESEINRFVRQNRKKWDMNIMESCLFLAPRNVCIRLYGWERS